MRLLIIDKTAVLDSNHERFEKISAFSDVELCVLSPTRWIEHSREVQAERTSHPGYEIRLGRTFWTGSYSRGFYLSGLREALREFQPDVIQLLEEPWSLFAGQAVRLARRHAPNAKILFYTWENIYREGTYCSKLDPLHRRIERRAFKECVSGVCATKTAGEVLRKRGFEGETLIIPYGISSEFILNEGDLRSRVEQPLTDPPRIGYIGRLLSMKGVDTLVRALPLTPANLVVIGDGPAESSLKGLAGVMGVSDRIEWLGSKPPAEIPRLMAGLDLLVLPSRTTPAWAEQLGRVMLEAMGSGVPVIGSSSGCIPEVVGDAGLIFPEDDSRCLAESTRNLISGFRLREDCIRKGWEKIRERYTWDRFSADLVDLYRKVESQSL